MSCAIDIGPDHEVLYWDARSLNDDLLTRATQIIWARAVSRDTCKQMSRDS